MTRGITKDLISEAAFMKQIAVKYGDPENSIIRMNYHLTHLKMQ